VLGYFSVRQRAPGIKPNIEQQEDHDDQLEQDLRHEALDMVEGCGEGIKDGFDDLYSFINCASPAVKPKLTASTR
jgi:hypothetical protein